MTRLRLQRTDLPLAAALAVELLVLALLPRVVTVDGPAHVAGAWVLANPGDTFLQRFYEIDLTPVPNMLTTFLLAGLLQAVGPDLSEKLLVAVYVVLLPLALRYALRGVDPGAGWLAVVAVPFTAGYLFLYGFYNFCLAVALSLAVAGLALRQRDGWRPRATAALAGLTVLTWSAHLLPALVAGLLVAVLAVARASASPPPRTAALRRHVLPPALAGLPVLGLTLLFSVSDAAERGAPRYDSWWQLAGGLVGLYKPLVAYHPFEVVPAAAVALVLAALAVSGWRRRDRGPERSALAVTTLLVTAGYFASPERYGSEYGFLNDRLSLFPPLLLLLWAAAPPISRRAFRAAVGTVLASAALLGALRAPTELRYQRDVAELMSVASQVPAHSVLLKLQLWRDPPGGGQVRNRYRDALRHEVSRIAALRDGVDAGHYEADLPYFPVRFRSASNPRRAVDPTGEGLGRVPPDVDLGGRSPVDVVLVLGRRRADARTLADPAAVRVLDELQAGYRRIAVSARSELVEVWVRR